MFNKNFFHLALGFAFMIFLSLAVVFGVGVYESEFKLKTNSATVFEQNKIIKKAIPEATLNLKNNEEKEWPPRLE